jgi:hypothetical protein
MKRLLLGIGVLTLFVASVCAQEHGQAASRPERPASKWFTYTSAEGRYSVSFTEQPKLSTQKMNAASGDDLLQYVAGASADPAYLMVSYFDYPPSNAFSLDGARDAMVDRLHGNLLDDESMSLWGSPGRAIKIAGKTENGLAFITRARFYDINSRIYLLQCLVPVSDEGSGATQICDQFFDSFKVKSPN